MPTALTTIAAALAPAAATVSVEDIITGKARLPRLHEQQPSFEIDINLGHSTQAPKSISPEKAMQLFGTSQAVKMNFVPNMLTALALDELTHLISECRIRRLSAFKKHTRIMAESMKDYVCRLRAHYGKAYAAYIAYVERYFKAIDPDRAKMWYGLSATAKNAIANPSDADVRMAVRIAIVRALLEYAEDYDKRMDQVIHERLGKPVRRRQDIAIVAIDRACADMAEISGWDFDFSESDKLNGPVLANRAAFLADEIIGEESNVTKR